VRQASACVEWAWNLCYIPRFLKQSGHSLLDGIWNLCVVARTRYAACILRISCNTPGIPVLKFLAGLPSSGPPAEYFLRKEVKG